MQRKQIACRVGGPIILVDSITQILPPDRDAIVVSGSHGGASSGEFALAVPLALVIFNDAGGGKDNAGIASLEILQQRNKACATIAHTSGRIGDAADMWENGIISHVNPAAQALGLRPGTRLQTALFLLVELE